MNSYIQTDARPKQMLQYSRALAEKTVTSTGLRSEPNLGTKVLADMQTIDEIFQGCSNPKVERLGTEVYGCGMKGAIAFQSQPWGGDPKHAKTLVRAAIQRFSALPINYHNVIRTKVFPLLFVTAISALLLEYKKGL